MPLKPSHNLLVRGSNPCGGTTPIVDFRLLISDLRFARFLFASQTHDGEVCAICIDRGVVTLRRSNVTDRS